MYMCVCVCVCVCMYIYYWFGWVKMSKASSDRVSITASEGIASSD